VVNSAGTAAANVFLDDTALGSPLATTWYYVVAWHDSTANTINIQINNGTPTSLSHTLGVYASGTGLFSIGSTGGTAAYMNGRIDEVSFWKRILTADERMTLYNSGNGLAYPFSVRSRRRKKSAQKVIRSTF
jgi:hypothetical protein